jgi:hypothetical protein
VLDLHLTKAISVWYVLSSMHVCCTYLLENLLSKYYLILLVHDTHFVCAATQPHYLFL